MADPDTDTLRKLAPCWSLAGDERLLTILQNTHQRLLVRCQEANCQLEQMATALDDASITLQNVNNQFMALSSSQFIESRVYDDDADVAVDPPAVKDSPKPSPPDELSILKRSKAVIESTHEVITILQDSDTESDTDYDLPDRLVMKPKDLYAERPLPYIIGSEPWKNKWHVGLMPEDSDTDSTTSKVDRDTDQYSQSETEESYPVHPVKIQDTRPMAHHVRNSSETSSELPSEATPTTKPTPSDVASEIARRLGAGPPPPKTTEPEPVYEEPTRHVVRKVYKPQEPVASTIFPDEPPPLEEQSEDDDIFAELNRHQPYSQPYSSHHVTEDLFGGNDTDTDQGGDIFSDFANQPASATKPTSLFDAGPTPHMFDKQPRSAPPGNRTNTAEGVTVVDHPVKSTVVTDDDKGVKKPVGGISLFGSNKGAESIGAAILKRNQRKASTSGDESGNDVEPVQQPQAKKERDIFDDLFARNEVKKEKPSVNNIVKDIKQEIKKKDEAKIKKDTPKPVDLFSDNLFDDIDDIFTTNIVKTSNDNKKSIFEDDDGLFSEIAEPKTVQQKVKSSNDSKKPLFDSDDDLFSENIAKVKPSISNKTNAITKTTENTTIVNEKSTKPTKTTSLFDDEEDNIFTNINTSKLNDVTKVQNVASTGDPNLSKNIFKSPSLFTDDDDGDLFTAPVKPTNIQKKEACDKVSEDMSSKTEENLTEKTDRNINTISDEISKETSTIIEVNNTDVKIDRKSKNAPSNSIKTDEIINKQIDIVEKEPEIFKNNIIEESAVSKKEPEIITNNVIEESTDTNNLDNPESVKQTVDNKDLSVNTKNKLIQNNVEDIFDKSEDEFSEQDFDDEPIQEPIAHQNKGDIPDVSHERTNIHDIFDKTALEEDIFASPKNIPNLVLSDDTGTEKIENSTTIIDENADIIPKSDIFTDIVTEPPVFEKPKEPKRSKNVNALFDDDSDDESLFFKKDDVISDEKPEDFVVVKPDTLFDLFTDEPPDVDFTKIDDDLDDDLFSTLPKPKIPSEKLETANNESFAEALPDNVPVDDEIKNTTTLPKAENPTVYAVLEENIDDIFKLPSSEEKSALPVQEPSRIPGLEENIDDIFKLPASEEKSALPIQETSNIPGLEENIDDIFKLPASEEKSALPIQATSNIPGLEENTDDIFKLPSSEEKSSLPIKEAPRIPVLEENIDDIFRQSTKENKASLPIEETGIYADDIQKQPLSLIEQQNLSDDDDDEELFKSLPVQLPKQKTDVLTKSQEYDYKSDEELFKSLPILEKTALPTKATPKSNIGSKEFFKIPTGKTDTKKNDIKKVGKLNVGLNINVNALLPGASPKKAKPIDSPDGQTQSNTETQKEDPKLTKAVSFDGKPESEVLDNKLSKERPRIQVKRRPSTRKARREAVRKSGIDFGDDSTDNSSSIDDPPKTQAEITKKAEDLPNNEDKSRNNEDIAKEFEPKNIESISKPIDRPIQAEIQTEIVDKVAKIEPEKQPVKSESMTKIVYILNDEDIFNTSAIENPDIVNNLATNLDKQDAKKPENIGSVAAKNTESVSSNIAKSSEVFSPSPAIKTLGNAHPSKSKDNKKTKSLFGEDITLDDDDELFRNKKPAVKAKIFDSDSDEDLFGTAKKVDKVMKVEKVIEVKGSLFGDDDDDDLFGVKTKKNAEPQPQPPRQTPSLKETAKPTQPVFEDPLSMFGDDD